MVSINWKNCYITQKIDVGLKKVKRCSIDKIQLIEYNQVKSCVTIIGMQIYIFKSNIGVNW